MRPREERRLGTVWNADGGDTKNEELSPATKDALAILMSSTEELRERKLRHWKWGYKFQEV